MQKKKCKYCSTNISDNTSTFCSEACAELYFSDLDSLDSVPSERDSVEDVAERERLFGLDLDSAKRIAMVRAVVHGARYRASKKNLDFDISEKWFWDRFGKCEVTGMDLVIGKGYHNSVEIDRIDPAKGYTKDNCRLVAASFNRAKSSWTDENVKEMARNLLGIA